MKIGESFPHKVTLRFSDKQYDYLCKCAVLNDCSVSDIIRDCVLNSMLVSRKLERNNKYENKKNNRND